MTERLSLKHLRSPGGENRWRQSGRGKGRRADSEMGLGIMTASCSSLRSSTALKRVGLLPQLESAATLKSFLILAPVYSCHFAWFALALLFKGIKSIPSFTWPFNFLKARISLIWIFPSLRWKIPILTAIPSQSVIFGFLCAQESPRDLGKCRSGLSRSGVGTQTLHV